ncbi:hypothetical protein PG990_002991 [Apiospora arundinis]
MAGRPPSTKKGANPAPDYTTMFNSIELLQAARSRKALSSSSASFSQRRAAQQQALTTATTKPAAAATATGKSTATIAKSSAARTAALLAQAKAEEADLDRLAMDDDNAGVGLHGGAPKTAEQLARMREDRKLASRLLGKKRRADEAKGQRMRGEDHPSSDDEPGRSGVGRAKKKVRRDVVVVAAAVEDATPAAAVEVSTNVGVDTDMKDGEDEEKVPAAAAAVTEKMEKKKKTSADSSEEDQQAEGDKETGAVAGAATSIGDQPKATDGENTNTEAMSKKKRKKKNKKKSKAGAPPSDG